ncbi:MAG: adenosylcobinamide amidohydrolase [Nitrospirae bacterium]|nr:adenosylcobinamide amidohydrolase [Nitrospirota bacterium]
MMPMDTDFRLISDALLIRFQTPRRVLSSAVLGGGFLNASFILNHWIRKDVAINNPDLRLKLREHPALYLETRIRPLGLEGVGVGLMTAVNIPKKLVVLRQDFKDLWVEGFFTVGVGNAVRAGDSATDLEPDGDRPIGTINMILITNARLSDPAMVEAVQVSTEAKTAILLGSRIQSRVSSNPATGTGTDCTAIVSGHGRPVQYCGTHTKMGELFGRIVSDGIMAGLKMCKK